MRISRTLIWTSAVIVFLVITVLSLLPPKSGVEIPGNDKVGHFMAYFVFTINCSLLIVRRRQLLWVLPLVILYGVLIEFLQGLIPGRMPSGLDVLANSSGAIVGAMMGILILQKGWIKL